VLAGFDARFRSETGDKVTRFNPVSAQAERGNIDFVRGPWNDDVFRSLEAFPDGRVKDDADAFSAAFDELLEYSGPIDMRGAEVGGGLGDSEDDDSPWAGRH